MLVSRTVRQSLPLDGLDVLPSTLVNGLAFLADSLDGLLWLDLGGILDHVLRNLVNICTPFSFVLTDWSANEDFPGNTLFPREGIQQPVQNTRVLPSLLEIGVSLENQRLDCVTCKELFDSASPISLGEAELVVLLGSHLRIDPAIVLGISHVFEEEFLGPSFGLLQLSAVSTDVEIDGFELVASASNE